MKIFIIKEDLIQALLHFLIEHPYKIVHIFIETLKTLKVHEIKGENLFLIKESFAQVIVNYIAEYPYKNVYFLLLRMQKLEELKTVDTIEAKEEILE